MVKESFEIKLPEFEGPFDLLLFFIQRDELDIYDIPISKIAKDFLNYIDHLNQLNIEVAGEFILVAATLMRIKAKMLIPRPELDEEGNTIDPREDLVQRLLEYKKFKSVVGDLEVLQSNREKLEERGNLSQELKNIMQEADAAEELHSLDLYKLLKSFDLVMKRFENEQDKTVHTIERYPYTIENQKSYVLNSVARTSKINFESVLQHCQNKVHLVYTFIAILELLHQQLLDIQVGIGFNNFWLSKKAS
jgi:segregation and condensation protein A